MPRNARFWLNRLLSSRAVRRSALATILMFGWYSVLRAAGDPTESPPRRQIVRQSAEHLPLHSTAASEESSHPPRSARPPLGCGEGTCPCTPEAASSSHHSHQSTTNGSETQANAETGEEKATLLGEFGKHYIDGAFDSALGWKEKYDIPIQVGAWHWYHESLVSSNDGYGIEGLRGTYWWEIIADPEIDLGEGRKLGAHVNYRLRDGDFFRSFFDSKFWSYELYGYYGDEQFGTFKAGQIWKRFGLDWDGVFFGNVPYFDGFKLDPDYGLSWEKTTEIDERFKVQSFVQFYFHEDGVNGSFAGADTESIAGIQEKNTGVVRVIPTWSFADDSTLALGFSGLTGEIDSDRAGIPDEVTAAWAVDATYSKDRWKFFGEVLQSYGRINPNRFVSGGPSNRLTDFLFGVHYTVEPVTYRVSYSLGLDSNPSAEHSMLDAGATIALTENVDLYIEYINQHVDGNASGDFIEFFNSLDFIIHWKY